MTSDEDEWISCAEALGLARRICGTEDAIPARGHPTHVTVLALAAEGLIKSRSVIFKYFYRERGVFVEGKGNWNFALRLISQAELEPTAKWIGRGTDVDYLFDVNMFDYSVGAFSFGHDFSDEKYVIVGLQFSKSDLTSLISGGSPTAGLNLDSPDLRVESKRAAENECAEWLKRQFASGRIATKADFQSDALKIFGNRLGVRGFARAWDLATLDFPARKGPGRKTQHRIDSRD